MKTTIKILMVALCAHLLYTNSELLIAAKDMTEYKATTFDKVALTAFALSYSLISALCVFHIRKYWPVLVFALLDGFAVYLRINVLQEHFLLITSVFFGFYTFCLISFIYILQRQERDQSQTVLPENQTAESKNKNENQQNEVVLMESESKTTVKQLVCRLNPMKDDAKRLALIEQQPPEIRSELLTKYGYSESDGDSAPTLF